MEFMWTVKHVVCQNHGMNMINIQLQICRDECELFELLSQEDAKEGKHYEYRLL